MNLDNYVGPSVRIVSPEANSTVSGDVRLEVKVADVLPLLSVEVFVGETAVGSILPGQGGVMNLPTYWFPNGEHQVWVRVVNEGLEVDTDNDEVLDSSSTFSSWGSVSVTFSNGIYMENFSQLYSFYGLSYFATAPHDYTFEVFRLNGELLHTNSGMTLGGQITPPWNFTDLNGNFVDDPGYVFSMTATPLGAAPSPPPPPPPSPSTNSPPPPPPAPGGQQQQSFQGSSDGELRFVHSGASLPSVDAPPQVKLTSDELAAVLAKIADGTRGAGPPPLPPSPPKLSFTASAAGAMSTLAAGSKTIKTTNFFDKGVTVGKYLISFGEWPRQAYNDWYEAMNTAVSARVNEAAFYDSDIIGENREAHGTIRADFSSVPYAIKAATQTNDLVALTNALADTWVGSWLWEGHSYPDDMIYALDGYLTVKLLARDVAALFGNRISPSFNFVTNIVYTRRLFSTFITGCGALNGSWPLATGTPHGVKQEGNPFIRKSAFLGFSGISKVSTDGYKVRWISDIHNIWIDGQNYDTPLKTGFDLANFHFPGVVPWGPGLLGYRFLHYDGEGARY